MDHGQPSVWSRGMIEDRLQWRISCPSHAGSRRSTRATARLRNRGAQIRNAELLDILDPDEANARVLWPEPRRFEDHVVSVLAEPLWTDSTVLPQMCTY